MMMMLLMVCIERDVWHSDMKKEHRKNTVNYHQERNNKTDKMLKCLDIKIVGQKYSREAIFEHMQERAQR